MLLGSFPTPSLIYPKLETSGGLGRHPENASVDGIDTRSDAGAVEGVQSLQSWAQ